MPLTIWDTDPDNKPKERPKFTDDTVGKFHSGRMGEDGNPETLSEWKVTTGDPVVAEAIAQIYGGEPLETDSTSENFIEVFTDRSSVPVILDGPDSIYVDMKQWNRGKLVHHCDGSSFLSHPSRDELIGQPCGCPALFAERKQLARDYMGPSPSIEITFRLADDPELGKFKFRTGSWVMAAVLHEYGNALDNIPGEALAELTLTPVEFKAKNGPRKGQMVSYTKPELNRIRSYNKAIAE